jgi:hypothetical protein
MPPQNTRRFTVIEMQSLGARCISVGRERILRQAVARTSSCEIAQKLRLERATAAGVTHNKRARPRNVTELPRETRQLTR